MFASDAFFDVLRWYSDSAVSCDDNASVVEVKFGYLLFGVTMEYEGAISGGAIYFAAPLVEKYIRDNDEGTRCKVKKDGGDHGDGLAETHFISDEAAATLRFGIIFFGDTPLNAIILMLFKVNTSFVDKPTELIHNVLLLL